MTLHVPAEFEIYSRPERQHEPRATILRYLNAMKKDQLKKNAMPAEEALHELLCLSFAERCDAIAVDVNHSFPRYSAIDAYALAEALGVEQPEKPGIGWSFTSYAHLVSVEDYAEIQTPVSEIIFLVEGMIEPRRFAELCKNFQLLDNVSKPNFSFLTSEERTSLEKAIADNELEGNASNGICCIANYKIECPCGEILEFEAEIEDDGSSFTLRTPYDKRANNFLDLSDCVTRHW